MEGELANLETRFEEALIESLRSCASGYWGMFGQNKYPPSKEGAELLDLAELIATLRDRLGYSEANPLCARYLDYRKRRGSNDLGEPRLAEQFLADLDVPTLS
jgi:hypothetical protein